MSLQLVWVLVFAAFVAGMVDSIAGGGGLITVPALLLAGASPIQVLATNKLQSSFGTATATWSYARAGHVKLREQGGMILVAFLSGAGGAILAQGLPVTWLKLMMPVILVGVALFFAFKRGLSDADRVQRMSPEVFAITVVPLIAGYDGFFGPGTGSFLMLGFVMWVGFGMLKATAHTKALNLASNVGSLVVFISTGSLWWMVGFAMAGAQMAGAMIGTRLAMRVGARLIKPLLVVTSSAMAARLVWQALVMR